MNLLAADIGGTKTVLALFEGRECIRQEKFSSVDFTSLEEILQKFNGNNIEKACFGIAGPIKDGKCQTTNLPWIIDAEKIEKECQIRKVYLINDLEATAWGLNWLKQEELFTLNPGKEIPGNQGVIAAGTGLGEAGLFWDGKKHLPFPSEGGHVDFSPRTEREWELFNFLKKSYDHVSYERVLSGMGLKNLYAFLSQKEGRKETKEIENLPRFITEEALNGKSSFCEEILNWFVSLYGAEAGNVALKYLTTGGLFLAGGIAPKILPALKTKTFMEAFCDKGRFDKLLWQIPVKVVLNQNTALLGAARYAHEHTN